jgi:tRNA 2-selenouridine synthase
VIETLERLCPQLPLQVVCGATGSAKTRVLQALAAQGAQVLDLEGLARHKGSMLGAVPGVDQPSQKAFETGMAAVIEGFDLSKPVYVEAESRKIGRMSLPTVLIERMRASPCLEIVAPFEARIEFLLRDYAYLGDDGEALALRFDALRTLHGHETVNRWQGWARQRALPPLFAELSSLHYDPLYARSQALHFHQWVDRKPLHSAALDDAGVEQLAQALLAMQAAA